MSDKIYPIGKVNFDRAKGTLRIEDGIISQKGGEMYVDCRSRTYLGVQKSDSDSVDLSGKISLVDCSQEEKDGIAKMLDQQIEFCERRVRRERIVHNIRDNILSYSVISFGGGYIILEKIYELYKAHFQ